MLVHVVYVSSRLEIMHFVVWYMTQGNIHRRLLPLTRAMLRRFFFIRSLIKSRMSVSVGMLLCNKHSFLKVNQFV